jgi:DNA-directed RNA polymerase subunit RPC12/RpoP
MTSLAERPALKWVLFLATLGVGGFLVFMVIRNTYFSGRGIAPDKQVEVFLTCTNPQCPGRTAATAHPDADPGTLGPYKYRELIRADFCDWPLTCPKCGQKSVYHIVATQGGQLTVHRLSDKSVRCPHCGKTFQIESFATIGPVRCPHCQKACGG